METIDAIVFAHRSRSATPLDTMRRTLARIRAYGDPALFITLREEADVLAEAAALTKTSNAVRPLFGVPVAVKDNIDVAGLPTTAGCPAFSYMPKSDSTVIEKLRAAGAIVVGKTNLDQFATGLVGTRSPYGTPRNPLRSDLIPGGSSSGSAVAVAAGLVPLALGSDTAGSGRVPAMMNNIVGLKPSLGLVSTAGVVPACRTLDCVSVFALTVEDAFTALSTIVGLDPRDPYSRSMPLGRLTDIAPIVRIGVPRPGARVFFGDERSTSAYDGALEALLHLGVTVVEIDIEPFYEAARLLYDGPWLAERFFVVRSLLASSPDSIHPVTRQIIAEGARSTAVDAFAAFYRLEELRRVAEETFREIDALVVPTAPTIYTVEQVLAEPVQTNSRLGTYTNFVNLLNLCAVAVPASLREDGAPFGITLIAPAGRDAHIASIGRAFHEEAKLSLGATGAPYRPRPTGPADVTPSMIEIVVLGAHLSGLTLNHELLALGASFVREVRTAPHYRLYQLPGGPPARPGLVRVSGKGGSIEAEIWAMSPESFGRFVAAIPAPLSVGTVELTDGTRAKGFLAEAAGVEGARDISEFGGWRAFLAERS